MSIPFMFCDYGNDRIQALSKNNYVYIRHWGKKGLGDGQFSCPYSIFYDEKILYVGDNKSVQLFTCEGKFLQKIGSKQSKEMGQFKCAWGICVIEEQLYVSDYSNGRIQVFRRSKSEIPIKIKPNNEKKVLVK